MWAQREEPAGWGLGGGGDGNGIETWRRRRGRASREETKGRCLGRITIIPYCIF